MGYRAGVSGFQVCKMVRHAGARIPFVPYDSTGRSIVPTALAAARVCLAPGLKSGVINSLIRKRIFINHDHRLLTVSQDDELKTKPRMGRPL